MMFDPLSLTDFESIRGASEATINVKVTKYLCTVVNLCASLMCVRLYRSRINRSLT